MINSMYLSYIITINTYIVIVYFAGAYFCLSMILITMSTVLACVVANMYFRGVRVNRAPRWLRVVRSLKTFPSALTCIFISGSPLLKYTCAKNNYVLFIE